MRSKSHLGWVGLLLPYRDMRRVSDERATRTYATVMRLVGIHETNRYNSDSRTLPSAKQYLWDKQRKMHGMGTNKYLIFYLP